MDIVDRLIVPIQQSGSQSTHPLLKEQDKISSDLQTQFEFYKNEQLIVRREVSNLIKENQRLYQELQSIQKQRLLSSSPSKRKGTDMVANLQQQLSLTIQEKNSAIDMWQLALTEVDSLERELKAYECNKHVELAQKQLQQATKEYSDIVGVLEEKLKYLSAEAEQIRLRNENLKCSLDMREEELRTALLNIELKDAEMKEGLDTTTTAIAKIQELEALVSFQCTELTAVHTSRDDLEKALEKSHSQIEHLVIKAREAHNKLHEALLLVDDAMRERTTAILSESNAKEEIVRLKSALADLIEEAGVRVKAEVDKVKKDYMEKTNILYRDMKNIANTNTEKNSLLEQMKREQQQLSLELETSKRAQEIIGPPLLSEHKMQAAYQELKESEHRNYRASIENENLRQELQKCQESHTKFLGKKEREWQRAEERYSTVCSKLIAAQEHIVSLEKQLSLLPIKSCLQCSNEKNPTNSSEKMELLSQLQEIQTQRLKTNIELQQHLECQRVLKVKWQTTIKSVTNTFEAKIRDLRLKLQEMKHEKREMQEQLNEAVRYNNSLLLGKEIHS